MSNQELIYAVSRRIESARSRAMRDLPADRWKTIEKFMEHCQAEGLTKARILRLLYDLTVIGKYIDTSFEAATTDDIKRLVANIEGSHYSYHSKYGMRVTIKKFYKWLKGDCEIFPPEVRWIKNNHKNDRIKLPEDMLTEREILTLIKAATKPRDKAMIALVAETGCRIGELLSCKIKNYKKDADGRTAHVFLNGKTGFRSVMIISCVPYMDEWINLHPFSSDPNAFIWCADSGKLLTYARVRTIFAEIAKRAGIKKATNPHNFRHTRATYLASRFTESQMKQYLGWTQASDMAAVYVHLSGRDVDKTVMKLNGIEVKDDEPEESPLQPKECFRCQKLCEASSKFCQGCGSILDKEEMDRLIKEDLDRKKIDEYMNAIIHIPGVKEFLEEKVKQVANNDQKPGRN